MKESFYLQKDNIYAVPIIHYNMEMAANVRNAFLEIKPACVAVELSETLTLQSLHAASRLPDLSLVVTYTEGKDPLFYMCEPCDPAFEGLRSAQESQIPAYCIDLDIDSYPDIRERVPDPYAVQRIGLKSYYEVYSKIAKIPKTPQDKRRELYMARRLKELSLTYDTVFFIGGMAHVEEILKLVDEPSFPSEEHAKRDAVELCTPAENSSRDIMAEYGWVSKHYETFRESGGAIPDRQKLILKLYSEAGKKYEEKTGSEFPGYHFRNLMKFCRNYALITGQLLPDLYQVLTAAKGCVDHNFAYETWELATDYPFLKNVDNLPELDLSIEEVWGHSKIIRFHLKEQSRKSFNFKKKQKKGTFRFQPPGPFSICSFPPEDVIVEEFGRFLQKKGTNILSEEEARAVPFTSSLEDGIDTKETIRHLWEKKLYVKVKGKPPGGVGSLVVIFDEDPPEEGNGERFPWHTTWLGEHEQESDMAFYATNMGDQVVGPGISRCKYGGFMMSYPPRRIFDIWQDPDYKDCRTKAEVLLMAAIDYAIKPIVVYVAAKPPRSFFKSFAERFGKKLIYLPIGQLSPITLKKIRHFHVLDSHDKRGIADEYIDF